MIWKESWRKSYTISSIVKSGDENWETEAGRLLGSNSLQAKHKSANKIRDSWKINLNLNITETKNKEHVSSQQTTKTQTCLMNHPFRYCVIYGARQSRRFWQEWKSDCGHRLLRRSISYIRPGYGSKKSLEISHTHTHTDDHKTNHDAHSWGQSFSLPLNTLFCLYLWAERKDDVLKHLLGPS